jgi:FkbM family methyltransferase
MPQDKYEEIYFQSKFYWNDPFLELLKHPKELISLIPKSKSQVRQDLFAISELDFKENGFFVEIGAQDGVSGSNTYMLEKDFAWRGIVVEPSRTYETILQKNRKCKVENSAIWSVTGATLQFADLGYSGLSSLKRIMGNGIHGKTRSGSDFQEYEVRTLSLFDLLQKHDAPKIIDYISIDTEGSEYEIIENFDFGSYDVKVLTIHKQLITAGYTRKYIEISHQDDWYVKI